MYPPGLISDHHSDKAASGLRICSRQCELWTASYAQTSRCRVITFASPSSTSNRSAQSHTRSRPDPISITLPLRYFTTKSDGRVAFVFLASSIPITGRERLNSYRNTIYLYAKARFRVVFASLRRGRADLSCYLPLKLGLHGAVIPFQWSWLAGFTPRLTLSSKTLLFSKILSRSLAAPVTPAADS